MKPFQILEKELDTAKADASSTLRNTNPSVEQVRNALREMSIKKYTCSF